MARAGLANQPPSGDIAPDTTVTPTTTAPAAPVADAPFDFDTTWNGLDERTRTGLADKFYSEYNSSLERDYPEFVSLAREAQANPQLRNVLKEFSSDKELREFIADGGTFEQLRSIQKDPEYRNFLFKDATETYRKYQTPQQQNQPADAVSPLQKQVHDLQTRFETEANVRDQKTYIDSRLGEIEALKTAAPTLRENGDLMRHVVTQAENNFVIAAMNSGVNTQDPNWAALAVRAGVRPPSYIDVYRQYERLTGKTPPPAAPQGSAPVRRSTPQAPRTKVEAQQKLSKEERKQRFLASVKKG